MESLRHTVDFPVAPETVYKAWLNSEEHSAMTGGEAVCSDQEGAGFTAWDGYIEGKNIKLIPNKQIVQSWRTTEFADSDEDSMLQLDLEESDSGTRLTLIHNNIPAGQTQYENGWVESYFKPMASYFNAL